MNVPNGPHDPECATTRMLHEHLEERDESLQGTWEFFDRRGRSKKMRVNMCNPNMLWWALTSAMQPWPYRTHEPPDVWLYYARPRRTSHWRYFPALMTIAEAFSDVNASVAYTDETKSDDVVAKTKDLMDSGRRPLIVMFGFWNQTYGKRTIKTASSVGAFVVFYNLEPICGGPARQRNYFNISEIWDYSYKNIEYLMDQHAFPRKMVWRVVPPGYVKQIDLLKLRSGMGVGSTAPSCTPSNVTIRTIHTWNDLKAFLATHPFQILFKQRCATECPFDALRAAVLAANHACIFAEDAIDFQDASPLVSLRTSFDMDEHGLDDCRDHTYNTFRNMRPFALVARSGIFDLCVTTLNWNFVRSPDGFFTLTYDKVNHSFFEKPPPVPPHQSSFMNLGTHPPLHKIIHT